MWRGSKPKETSQQPKSTAIRDSAGGNETNNADLDIFAEISDLQDRLESKSKAMLIMSKELLEVRAQRDQYRSTAETLREKCTSMKSILEGYDLPPELVAASNGTASGRRLTGEDLARVISNLRQANLSLKHQVDELRVKLSDSEGDIKLMREQLASTKVNQRFNQVHTDFCNTRRPSQESSDPTSPLFTTSIISSGTAASAIKSSFVSEIETLTVRVKQLERDLEAVLDEKQELIVSRDEYKRKCDRLNGRLNEIIRQMSGEQCNNPLDQDDSKEEIKTEVVNMRLLDIDSMFSENVFLKAKIGQLESEKDLFRAQLAKYKSLIGQTNRKTPKGSKDLKSTGNQGIKSFLKRSSQSKSSSDLTCIDDLDSNAVSSNPIGSSVIRSTQVQQFIVTNGLASVECTPENISRLTGLVIALYESLQDKSSGLAVYRKTNSLMGGRLVELERQLDSLMKERSRRPEEQERRRVILLKSACNSQEDEDETLEKTSDASPARKLSLPVEDDRNCKNAEKDEVSSEDDGEIPEELKAYIQRAEQELKRERDEARGQAN